MNPFWPEQSQIEMTNLTPKETYVSVDVETSGPYPGEYSLLAIGACVVDDPEKTFYVELKPVSDHATEEAIAIHGLSLVELAERGLEPAEAMNRFEEWLTSQTPADQRPIFVGFNAAFDWMFVNDYFHRFLGYNPFGHTALDIKSFYMGAAGVAWAETTMRYVSPRYLTHQHLTHQALRDALDQADIFYKMLAEARKK
jgi:DNA polymerase III epsilon subunit-like protein